MLNYSLICKRTTDNACTKKLHKKLHCVQFVETKKLDMSVNGLVL